jgi:DNA (cytosine-5)-methyltransferase 1
MKYLSVCSGIEAASVAWKDLGWKAEAFSEIEAFPSAVLQQHYKDTPNLGDMTKYESWNINTIDLLVGGTPCQSFSVAGLRQGLKDPRGNLMLTYLAIADRYRPKWTVWENVPGVLSSAGGRDFGTFLGALVELGYGFAYRILDAQWFGVAQRRRRVFVVGCLGSESLAAKVLFERESVSRNPAPSREKKQGTATNVADCLRSGGAGGVPSSRGEHLVVGSLDTECGGGKLTHQSVANGHIVLAKPEWWNGGDLASTITSSSDDQRMPDKGNAQLVMQTTATAFEPGIAGREGGESRFTHEITGTLRKAMGDNQTAVAYSQAIPLNSMAMQGRLGDTTGRMGSGIGEEGDPCPTISKAHSHAVALYENHSIDSRVTGPHEVSPSCRSAFGTGGGNIPLVHSTAVRRLTPTECERLQGFPDGYTNIPWRKKTESPDGPRYKALGNSMAVPVMRWIGERIDKVNKEIQS